MKAKCSRPRLGLFVSVGCLLTCHITWAGSATWNSDPVDNDWNNPANWTPNTVPNGPNDVARFGSSNKTDLIFSARTTEVAKIVFTPEASSFTITASPAAAQTSVTLTISGAGIINNSVLTQTLTAGPPVGFDVGIIEFRDSATAGEGTALNALASEDEGSFPSSLIIFYDTSSAGSSSIYLEGAVGDLESYGGAVYFYNNATAGEATCRVTGAFESGSYGAEAGFFDDSSAGNATFSLEGPSNGGFFGGEVFFADNSNAANAHLMAFSDGTIDFAGGDGGQARIELLGGTLDLTFFNSTDLTVGSIEGEDGVIVLGGGFGSHNLATGSNNLSTTFSGTIAAAGSLEKIGTGTLTLTGNNNYIYGTTVTEGTLLAANLTGSATGSGSVQVHGGTLGGGGTIEGAVVIGTGSGAGAVLDPAATAKKIVILVTQSPLTMHSDATYRCTIDFKNSKSTAVKANGVTLSNGPAIVLKNVRNGTLAQGKVFKIISNTSANPISGTFSNLADGAIVNVGGTNFQADYQGGDGNDLTLTVVP